MPTLNLEIEIELKEISPLLAGIPKTNVFALPEGYFEKFPSNILQSVVSATEQNPSEAEIRPALPESVRTSNVFEVPSDYFDNLASEINNKLKQQPARAISIRARKPFFNYAVAAVLSGIIGLSLFNLWVKPDETATEDIRPLMAAASEIISKGSFQQEWESLKEEEITGFLSENGHDVHAALVAAASEKSELPEVLDYIVKEDALGEFLDKLELTSDPLNQ